jgi:exodeoxyribonuclease VII small subunit
MNTRSLTMSINDLPSSEGDTPSFESALERIREIVALLEGGELTLEESISTFQEGSRLIEQSRNLIADAELRINELSREDDADQ